MKNKLRLILFFFILLSMTSCFKVKELQVKEVESVKIINMTDSYADLAVTLRVFNPNNMKITVKSLDLDAFVNKKYIGKINTDKKIIIHKKSDNSYTVLFKADMNEVRKILPSMVFASQALVNLKGGIKVKAKGFNKNICVDIDEKVSKKDLKGIMTVSAQP